MHMGHMLLYCDAIAHCAAVTCSSESDNLLHSGAYMVILPKCETEGDL